MAYQVIQTKAVTQNGIVYQSEYDLSNGKTRIIQTNAPTGTQPIYQDGAFTAEANRIGLTDTTQRQNIHNSIAVNTRTAHNTAGGTAKGYTLPEFAKPANTGNAPGVPATTPSSAFTSPDPSTSSTSSTSSGSSGTQFNITNITGNIAAVKSALGGINFNTIKDLSVNSANFGVANEDFIFGRSGKSITYPSDMNILRQDHITIQQFRYVPPNAESIFSGATNIWTNGLGRGADRREKALGIVYLPMPNQVVDSNSCAWDGNAMNSLSAGAMAEVGSNLSAYAGAAFGGQTLQSATGVGSPQMMVLIGLLTKLATSGALANNPSLQGLLTTDIQSKILAMAGQGVDPETILARAAGIVPNSNLEFLFKGPALRSFNNFSWRMTARSVEEAKAIRNLIRFFKQGMAPKKFTGRSGEPSYMLGTPNVFKLTYKTVGEPEPTINQAVNQFKTCALTQFATNYTPDGFWAAYDKGQPLSVSISMAFTELEPIYDTDYQESNVASVRTDLSSISNDAVGY